MIGSLLDQIQPEASDEEEDERPPLEFALQAAVAESPMLLEGAPGAGVTPGSARAVAVCCAGAGATFARAALALEHTGWSLAATGAGRGFPPPPAPTRLFVAGASALVLVLEGPVPQEAAGAWAEALLGGLGAAELLVLDALPRAAWRPAEARPLEPHLCGLWAGERVPGLAPLPAPNALPGLAAALLQRCEAQGRRCLVALALQDGTHLGEGCLRAFAGLHPRLSALGLLPAAWRQPDYSEALCHAVPPPCLSIYA